jgi:hypothetical protein
VHSECKCHGEKKCTYNAHNILLKIFHGKKQEKREARSIKMDPNEIL